jgi:hypothetical protein
VALDKHAGFLKVNGRTPGKQILTAGFGRLNSQGLNEWFQHEVRLLCFCLLRSWPVLAEKECIMRRSASQGI